MLTTAKVRWLPGMIFTLTLLAAGLVSTTTSAEATECVPVVGSDGVLIPCESEGEPGGPGDPGSGGDGNGGEQTCEHLGDEVPCSSDYGSWDGGCYVRTASPQPPSTAPIWEENSEGAILECTPYQCANAGNVETCPGHGYYWSPDAAAPVGPSAEELAQRAVASMNLTTGQIGSTPPSSSNNPNAVGAVGLPIWLWIATNAENAIGPITRSASGGALSVTATGILDRVEWTLTDANGTTVGAIPCSGANAPGTPYDGRNSAEPSPTCGFGADLNNSPGNLTLSGTAYWVVEWQSSSGQGGQIPFTAPSNSAQVRIGELQMLVQD